MLKCNLQILGGNVAKISVTGIAVNLMLGFSEQNQTAYASIKRYAAHMEQPQVGDKFTQFISDNKSRAKEWVDADLAQRKATKEAAQNAIIGVVPTVKPSYDKTFAAHATNTAVRPPETVQNVTPQAPEVAPMPTETQTASVPEQKSPVKRVRGATKSKPAGKANIAPIIITATKGVQTRLYLEPEFITALDTIAPTDRKAWLIEVINNSDKANPASAVRCAIVTALLKK